MMTRKNFEAIAAIVKSNIPNAGTGTGYMFDENAAGQTYAAENIADELADYFATENPNFNRQRFLKACGF